MNWERPTTRDVGNSKQLADLSVATMFCWELDNRQHHQCWATTDDVELSVSLDYVITLRPRIACSCSAWWSVHRRNIHKLVRTFHRPKDGGKFNEHGTENKNSPSSVSGHSFIWRPALEMDTVDGGASQKRETMRVMTVIQWARIGLGQFNFLDAISRDRPSFAHQILLLLILFFPLDLLNNIIQQLCK